MISPNSHREKWLHNREFLATISDSYADWIVCVALYAALHCVEVLFEHDGLQPSTDHGPRNGRLKATNRYKNIWSNYYALYDASQTARYHVGLENWISAKDAKEVFVGHHLHQIEKSVGKLMNQPPPDRIVFAR